MKSLVSFRSILSLLAVTAAIRVSLRTWSFPLISRRRLMKLAGLAAAALATGTWKRGSTAGAAGSVLRPSLGTCVLSPEQTEGPYYIPREKIRSNITEHRPGIPLKLRIAVIDASTCKPLRNAAVDIWHCDAGGIYSGFVAASTGGAPGGGSGPTDKNTFLRGVQFTNGKGICQFETVYPGWYRGRTVHIHVKVHLGSAVGHEVHTGQLYFSDSLTARVYQRPPYRSRAAARDTFNSTDGIYQSGGRQSTLSVKPDGHGGYIGTITLGIRRA